MQNKALNDKLQKYGNLMGKQRAFAGQDLPPATGPGRSQGWRLQGPAKATAGAGKGIAGILERHGRKIGAKTARGGKAMGDAQSALGRQDLPNAGSSQNQALDALRQGAQALADEAQQGTSKMGGGREDPLGRSNSNWVSPESRFRAPPIWPVRGRFWKNCAAAPPRWAGRSRNATISTGC
jgi:hypothetical protein